MWTERVYRALLRLFPTSEREWGADMLETYRRRAAAVKDSGRLVRLSFHLREWGGLAWAALDSRRGRGTYDNTGCAHVRLAASRSRW